MAQNTDTPSPIVVEGKQWLRTATLLVTNAIHKLDLSKTHFKFSVVSADFEMPDNAAIRIYNLSATTAALIRTEYENIILQVGYEGTAEQIIFQGDIKQFRTGREGPVDTYLDILAADGDKAYNYGFMNRPFAAGSTAQQRITEAAKAMGLKIGQMPNFQDLPDMTNTNPDRLARGRVAYGLARDTLRDAVNTLNCSWSIQNGTINITPLRGYLAGDAVVINRLTGMVGIPEQTDEGIRVQCLINPRIRIGGLIQLNSADINQIIQKKEGDPSVYNSYTGIQYASKVAEAADGKYRVYSIDQVGDIRGNDWLSTLVCLLINPAKQATVAKG